MIRLIQTTQFGMEVYLVIYTSQTRPGELMSNSFLDETIARNFINTKLRFSREVPLEVAA